MRTYLDSSPVIYQVERVQPLLTAVLSFLDSKKSIVIASELTRLECRVLPMRRNDEILLSDYERFFRENVHELAPMTREVFERATRIRADYNFKTPDALHRAAALVSHCDLFLTNDRRLSRLTEIEVGVAG